MNMLDSSTSFIYLVLKIAFELVISLPLLLCLSRLVSVDKLKQIHH